MTAFTLKQLEAAFLTCSDPNELEFKPAADVASAHGVVFLCPKCFAKNNGPVGTHSILCWFAGRVSDKVTPGPGRWNPQGTSLDDLTFVGPGAFSVLLTSGCGFHGFVENGSVREG